MSNPHPDAAHTSRTDRLHAILTRNFSPSRLEIQDDSAKHAGHSGARAGGETHYTITIVSDAFTSRTRLERSRMVHDALASEFEGGLHAISLILQPPGEYTS